jgi:peptide/nickel transport system ATP-binding protein
MYAGRKVEEAAVTDLFDRPMHPYTRGLMRLDPAARRRSRCAARRAEGDPGHRADR